MHCVERVDVNGEMYCFSVSARVSVRIGSIGPSQQLFPHAASGVRTSIAGVFNSLLRAHDAQSYYKVVHPIFVRQKHVSPFFILTT